MTDTSKWAVERDGPVTAINMHDWDGMTAEQILAWMKARMDALARGEPL